MDLIASTSKYWVTRGITLLKVQFKQYEALTSEELNVNKTAGPSITAGHQAIYGSGVLLMGMHAYWTIMCPHRGWYGNIGVLDFLASARYPPLLNPQRSSAGRTTSSTAVSPRDDTMSEEGVGLWQR